MAAVLCSSIGELFSGCGKIICLPCQACGIGCQSIVDVVTSSFFPYIFVTAAFNVPVVILGAKGISGFGGENCKDESFFMLLSGAFALMHIIACFYIIHRIREDREVETSNVATTTPVSVHDMESGKTKESTDYKNIATATATPVTTTSTVIIEDDAAPRYSAGRIKDVLCYDKGVALYIVITVVWIFWQCQGLNVYFKHDQENCADVASGMLTSLFCGWFFASLVGIAFLCSLCCV
eukprot:CAMPEP_0194211284 /NCGR_PEP_ID=MMETSP0156-20130528/9902_1 /TAXON_ID=33649 /ORGANISM="Thalassionema nitzschioides, Strain L26-B" /LENGTH=236 /DNA_ID=CAMNT_0038938793 /DNA_START=65 /DNA_END=772 /DNA_ORIENTATION=-